MTVENLYDDVTCTLIFLRTLIRLLHPPSCHSREKIPLQHMLSLSSLFDFPVCAEILWKYNQSIKQFLLERLLFLLLLIPLLLLFDRSTFVLVFLLQLEMTRDYSSSIFDRYIEWHWTHIVVSSVQVSTNRCRTIDIFFFSFSR